MKLEKRIEDLAESGKQLQLFLTNQRSGVGTINSKEELLRLAHIKNNWFEPRMAEEMLNEVVKMLNLEALTNWASAYSFNENTSQKVAIIMAGNIPMVGFHDLLSVLISNNIAWIKLSSKDEVLIPFWLELLYEINPEWKQKIEIKQNRLKNMDAVIATGSDNSARYFDYYFGKYPHIIRKNRTSVSVIEGTESDEELNALGKDLLHYFGLGCRNVSKLYMPQDFNIHRIFENLIDYDAVIENQKYFNNYQYNRTVFLLNNEPFLDNNFIILKEAEELVSPVGVVHYERYSVPTEVNKILNQQAEQIQCVVGKSHIPFGKAQSPALTDYADGVDVLAFLSSLQTV